MRYSIEDARKAAYVLLPDYKKYDLEIYVRKDILAENDEERYLYEVSCRKRGKEMYLGSFRNRHIRDALESLRKVYGYCRTSTPQQSIERQVRNIKAEYPAAIMVLEAYTGSKTDRPEWNKLYERVEAGDTIVFDSVSRMGRNADEGVETYFRLYEKGVRLVFLKEHYIDTSLYEENMRDGFEMQGSDGDGISEGLNNYFRKLAERQIRIAFERSEKEAHDLRQRTREGIETARLNGKQIGQKVGSKLTVKKEAPAKEKILKYSRDFNGSLSDVECIKLAGVSRNTYYKYKRQLRKA